MCADENERTGEAEPAGVGAPRWAPALRWSALGAAGAGVTLCLSGVRTLGLLGIGLGLLVAIVERALAPHGSETLEGLRVDADERDRPSTNGSSTGGPQQSASTPLRVLGYGSLGLTVLGLGLMARDVFAHERSGTSWLPLVGGTIGLIAAAFTSVASPERRAPVIQPPRDPRRRRLVMAVMVALLAIQALVPLRYYLGDDRFDERFSWRMFSAVRVYSCELTAFETRNGREQPKSLTSTIHVAWITTMRRNREAVMRRYLRWRCEQEGVEAARLVNRCTTPEGARIPDVVRSIDCASGALIAQGGER